MIPIKKTLGDDTVSNLGKKRLDAVLAIANCVVRNGAAVAVPTPGGEIPKQLILTASDILTYTAIWRIYFQEDLSSKQLFEILAEMGLVTVVATGTAYVASKATTAILKEIYNWTGPLGWGVTATITGSLTGLIGLAWAVYCDNLYCERVPEELSEQT
jgi:hypothetical protein